MKKWAWALFTRLELINQKMPAIIISDCDSKSTFFKKLEIELCYLITYYF